MRLPIKLNLASITAGDASTRTGFPGLTAHYFLQRGLCFWPAGAGRCLIAGPLRQRPQVICSWFLLSWHRSHTTTREKNVYLIWSLFLEKKKRAKNMCSLFFLSYHHYKEPPWASSSHLHGFLCATRRGGLTPTMACRAVKLSFIHSLFVHCQFD
jgi:hypothetical protein